MSEAAPNGPRNRVENLTIRVPGAPSKNRGIVGKTANAVTGAASGAANVVKGAATGALSLVTGVGKTVRNTAVSLTNPTSVTSINPGCVGTVCETAASCANAGCTVMGGKRKRKTRGNKRRATKKRRTVRRR